MPGFSLKSMHEIQAEQRGLLIEKNEHQLGHTTKASLKFVKKPARTVQNSVVVLSKKSRQVLLLASGKRCIFTKDFGFSLKYTRWRQENTVTKICFPYGHPSKSRQIVGESQQTKIQSRQDASSTFIFKSGSRNSSDGFSKS